MPCYHPIPAWYAKDRNESGKRSMVFSPQSGVMEKVQAQVPCGTCIGCKLERARGWAVRCMHEAQLHDSNSFVTLTYDDKHVPRIDGIPTLRPEDMVKFLKRLRKQFPVRFFQCGEYGANTLRPHHHALLFGVWFPDRVRYGYGSDGESPVFSSKRLDELWGYGKCLIGEVSSASAGYVARYTLKKQVDTRAFSGDLRVPEYLTMSRNPGIGRGWWDLYWRDWYARDYMVVNGNKVKPPRYYDSLVEKFSPGLLRSIKSGRRKAAQKSADNSGSRLVVREAVKNGSVSFLSRDGEF